MQTNRQLELNEQDERAYDDLMVSVEASSDLLSLLFAATNIRAQSYLLEVVSEDFRDL